MNEIRDYARSYGRDEANNFAVSCYDQNSIEELGAVLIDVENGANLEVIADTDDCAIWDISPNEWYEAIKSAEAEKRHEILD